MKKHNTHFSDVVKDLKSFEFAIREVVEGTLTGPHRSSVAGSSVEFSQHRPYTPGDDLKRVDWKTYARSDRFHLKEYEDETNTRVYLLLDASSSMDFGHEALNKFGVARYVAACLAYYFHLRNDLVSLLAFGQKIDFIPPRSNRSHLRLLLENLWNQKPSGQQSVLDGFEELRKKVHRRSIVIVLSDFLNCTFDELNAVTRGMTSGKHHMAWIQVADPTEETLPSDGFLNLQGMEGEEPLRIQGLDVRQVYEQVYGRFCKDLREIALKRKARMFRVTTKDSIPEILREISR